MADSEPASAEGPTGASAVTPWGDILLGVPPDGTQAKVLEAAFDLFAEQGLRATTMTQLAKAAGISRVWLYRHFENRDAVAAALLGRESFRFLADLPIQIDEATTAPGLAVDLFVHSILTLRSHPLLRQVLEHESEMIGEYVVTGIGPLLTTSVHAVASLLDAGGHTGDSLAVAETLVRLVVFAVINNGTTVDYDDPDAVRRYARAVVPALLGQGAAELADDGTSVDGTSA